METIENEQSHQTEKYYVEFREGDLITAEFIEKYCDKIIPWGFNGLGYFVYKRTYARFIPEIGRKEEWPETIARAINGAVRLGTPYTQEEAEKLFDLMFNLKCSVSGRGLWQLGTKTVENIGADSLLNCFGGATRVLTDRGWYAIKNLTGKKVKVLTKGGEFVESEIKHHGKQKLYNVEVVMPDGKSKMLQATDTHNWILVDENGEFVERVITGHLKPGMLLPIQFAESGVPGDTNTDGFLKGLCLAAGREDNDGIDISRVAVNNKLSARLDALGINIGQKQGLIYGSTNREDIKWHDKDYLFSLIDGFEMANDGVLSTGSLNVLELLKDILSVLGYSYELRTGKASYLLAKYAESSKTGTVMGVSEGPADEDVYCAEVPETHCFVIDGNILTGNCWVTKISNVEDFCFIFMESMLGGGVGCVISREYIGELPRVKKNVRCRLKNTADADFIVPDSKEGWCDLWRKLLEAYLHTGKSFTYSTICVRKKGEPIKTFGGVAPGDGPLIEGAKILCDILENREGEKLRTADVADIITTGGQVVKSGGVRRCLAAGTRVETLAGEKAIEDIKVGDMALTGFGWRKVIDWVEQGEQECIKVAHSNGELICTPNHRIAVQDFTKESSYIWKQASELTVKDSLINARACVTAGYDSNDSLADQCDWLSVSFISAEPAGIHKTYDLTVEEQHCFMAEGILVHNTALILMGDADDAGYMKLKRWDLGNIPNHRANSNNSLLADHYDDLESRFWDGYKVDPKTGWAKGEPYGLVNIKNSRRWGRIGETEVEGFKLKDNSIVGVNPCAESPLGSKESCVSGNTALITRQGVVEIKDAIKRKIEVWNGTEWSEVTPTETGRNRALYRVHMLDGSYLDCTGNHKFLFTEGCDCQNNEVIRLTVDELYEEQNEEKKSWFSSLSKKLMSAYVNNSFDCRAITCGPVEIDTTRAMDGAYEFGNMLKCALHMQIIDGEKEVTTSDLQTCCPAASASLSNYRINQIRRMVFAGKYQDIDTMFSATLDSIEDFIDGLCETPGLGGWLNNLARGSKRYIFAGHSHKLAMRIQMLFRKIGSFAIIKKIGQNYAVLEVSESWYRVNCVGIANIEQLDGKHTVYCFTEPSHGAALFGNTYTGNCNLAEIFLNNVEDVEEFWEASRLLYKLQKQIAASDYLFPETNEIVHKNMRLGLGVTGVCQKMDVFEEWCDEVYRRLRRYDNEYAPQNGWPQSVRLTTIKPSGTLSLLSGSTPGGHPAYSNYHIRRVRFASNDPLINHLKKAGYHWEYELGFNGKENHEIVIVSFPAKFEEGTVLSKDMTAVQQLDLVKRLNTCWADQAVSVTVYYKAHELPEIQEWLKANYDDSVKTVSFLLHSDHGFKQAPLEEISQERYEAMAAKLKPIGNVEDRSKDDDFRILDAQECEGGACPLK